MAAAAPTDVPVTQLPLSAEQRGWLERAWAQVDADRIAQLNLDLTNIPSPTGEERAIAEFLTRYMGVAGFDARYQPIDEQQGNAVGRLRGSGEGPELLLYAPTDVAFAGSEEEDVPWIGPSVRADLRPHASREGDDVIGLGAENPKAYVTCVVAAAEAVARAGVPLRGDVIVGLGAGGMPTNKRPGLGRWNTGQGNGCSFMLEQGVRGDFAILAKPGYAVAWEEVGISWHRVGVKGTLNYTGIRHVVPYTNPIVEATKVIAGLEEWFPEYSARNTSGLVAPQGSIGAVEGGWTYKPAFVPRLCNLYVDLRVSPRTDPMEVKHQLEAALHHIEGKHPELELDYEMILAIPGTHTDPQNWIVQSLMRAWEAREGRPHEARGGTSGATDAAILRGRGIPTARLGLPRAVPPAAYPGFSMGVAHVPAMRRLTECLVYAIVDTCTRDRGEVGLPA
ncbi:MAG TPA: peptidase dimerization domain-containing protein [Chloroflexota bacterium]|jgi:acetylornithine deacetylase/succinyl-diaminopimelate desuccinylase-like protein